jgi:hypothetical protein
MNTTASTTIQPGLVWPLLTSRYPNAHLTWTEWLAYQAATSPSEQSESPAVTAQPRPAHLRSRTHLNDDATARLDWPLPGTKVPNGRLTWTEWLTYQARGLAVREPEPAAPERAA